MKQYIVQTRWNDGDDAEVYTSMQTASEIVSRVDMYDCYDEDIAVWECDTFGELVPLQIHGTWHCLDDPLYIKATRPDGSIAFDGYGTDH